MSDRDASISDAAFREALDALEKLYDDCTNFDGWEEYQEALSAARAHVLALYDEAQQQGERDQLALAEQVAEATMRMEQGRAERQGEVYEATDIHNRHGIRVRVIKVPPQEFGVGDKVRVTKVEEAK